MNYLSELLVTEVEKIDDKTVIHCALTEGVVCTDDIVEVFYSNSKETDVTSESGHRITSLKGESGYTKPMSESSEDDFCSVELTKTFCEIQVGDVIKTVERGTPPTMFFTKMNEVNHFKN